MEKSYTLKTAFPNAKCSEQMENAIVSKINADVKNRVISAEVIFDTIVKRADIEKFRKEVIKNYSINDLELEAVFNTQNISVSDAVTYCTELLTEENSLWGAVLDSCIAEDEGECIKIMLRHGNRELLENDNIEKKLAALL